MPIYPRDYSDKSKIITRCPQQMKVLDLHGRMDITVTVIKEQWPSKFCIEYALLWVGGVPNPDLTLQLFSVGAIIKYVLKSDTNLIGYQVF